MSAGCRSARVREAGSATVVLVAVAGVVLMLSWAGLTLGAAVSAAHRARAAADLAALAAAGARVRGTDLPAACARGAAVASANGAVQVSCGAGPGGSVTVSASVTATMPLLGSVREARADARAGASGP